MKFGHVIADRYRVEALANSGGMGAVYAGLDLQNGTKVGIKFAHHGRDEDTIARFWLEANALSSVRHPGIVGYHTHGTDAAGNPYLIMDWLEGESLQSMLKYKQFSVRETLLLAIRICRALSAAHARGVIHRDIKPDNVLLRDRDVNKATLVDFGLVRMTDSHSAVTQVGTIVGTPSFMAPEQAMGLADIDGRVDVYAIGALIFTIVAHRPPFVGQHATAVLAKVLFEEAPALHELRDDIPPRLSEFVTTLLAKEPDDRPNDADAVAAALNELLYDLDSAADGAQPHLPGSAGPAGPAGTTAARDSLPQQQHGPAITDGEQRYLTVLVVDGKAARRNHERRQVLEGYASKYGGALNELADGTIIGVFNTGGKPHDIAVRAAHCALVIRAELDVDAIILATGRGIAEDRLPVGEVIDRAVSLLTGRVDTMISAAGTASAAPADPVPDALLDTLTSSPIDAQVPPHRDPALSPQGKGKDADKEVAKDKRRTSILIDDVTAGFVNRRFRLVPKGARSYTLLDTCHDRTRAPRLLGVDMACVGRVRELGTLDATLAECVDDEATRGVLLTAEPGMGKTRVCGEFLRRAQTTYGDLAVWSGAGNWLRSGASFALLGDVIRDAISMPQGHKGHHAQAHLSGYIAERFAPEKAGRISEFLGELMGIPFADHDRMQLAAARRDPQLMHDQMQRAFIDWLGMEVTKAPVLIVLDDLQWGDRPTLRFIEAAMRALRDQRLMVLALARPNFRDMFPDLCTGNTFDDIHLRPLSKNACRSMISQALKACEISDVGDDTVTQLIQRCEGNPFFLEELIRHCAAGGSERVPETVLAMTESRLRALPAEDRRVLRAASVVGRHFWRRSIAALLGQGVADYRIDLMLYRLAELEFIVERPESRFPGHAEYAFSHELTREAAYGTLTEHDRTRAHLSAGEWLEREGESEPLVLAEHFQRGGAAAEAVTWYVRAAKQALEAGDVETVIERVGRASDCGAEGEQFGALKLLEAEARNWRSQSQLAQVCSRLAIAHLPQGSGEWAHAIHQQVWASAMVGELDDVDPLVEALIARAKDNADPWYVTAMANCAPALAVVGRRTQARAIEVCIAARMDPGATNPATLAIIARLHSFLAYMDNELDRACDLMLEAASHWRSIGNDRCALMDMGNAGATQLSLGEYEHAAETLSKAVTAAEKANLDYLVITNKANWARALAYMGQTQAARTLCQDSLGTDPASRHEIFVRTYMAQILLLDGCAADALGHIERALAFVDTQVELKPMVLGVHAQTLLAMDQPHRALAATEQGLAIFDELGAIECGEGMLRLSHAEALSAIGECERARQAVALAEVRLQQRAASIRDPERRQGFFERVPEHARTMQLAKRWSAELH